MKNVTPLSPAANGAPLFAIVDPATGADHLDRLKARIIQYDISVRAAYGQQMGYAFLAGCALNQAKALLPYGKFTPWLDENLPLSKGSRQRYMAFAEAIQTQIPHVGNLAIPLLLTDGELAAADKEKVLAAVHEVADGKTLTQLYRDLGVIKTPKPDGGFRPPEADVQAWLAGHHPEHAGTKYADLTALVQAEFKAQWTPTPPSAEMIAEGHRATGRTWEAALATGLADKVYAHWEEAQRRQMRDLFRDWWQALNGTLKKDKKKSKSSSPSAPPAAKAKTSRRAKAEMLHALAAARAKRFPQYAAPTGPDSTAKGNALDNAPDNAPPSPEGASFPALDPQPSTLNCLLTVPVSDGNFASALAGASPDILRAALAQLPEANTKVKRAALERRLAKLENPQPGL